MGKVKFGKNGEWATGRTLMVQYQKIQGTGIEQFRGPGKKIVLWPDESQVREHHLSLRGRAEIARRA